MNLAQAIEKISHEADPKLNFVYYNKPFFLDENINQVQQKIHKLLHKIILYFVNNYDDFQELLPLSQEVKDLLRLCKVQEYQIGTFRPDFIIDENEELKICEINARFPVSGWFYAMFTDFLCERMAKENHLNYRNQNMMPLFFECFQKHFKNLDNLIFVTGIEKGYDLIFLKNILTEIGVNFKELAPEELLNENTKNCQLFIELNQDEILSLDEKVQNILATNTCFNDLRSVFIVHDKRFLSVLSNKAFLKTVLTDDESKFLQKHITPTFLCQNETFLKEVIQTKAKWVLKENLLGKSQGITIACDTDEKSWKKAIKEAKNSDMVLQHFVKQKKYALPYSTTKPSYNVVGMSLYFNDTFIGTGVLRTSEDNIVNVYYEEQGKFLVPMFLKKKQYFI